jgi:glycosyltransferase involved in cell wall biosynthesis
LRSNDPIDLLVATPLFLPHIGGVERIVYELSVRLAEKGARVTVVTTDATRALPRTERLDGFEVVRVPAWPRDRDYYLAPDLYRVVTGRAWDLVHVHSYHTLVAPLVMLAAQRRRIPYALSFHAGGHSSPTRRRLRRLQWATLRPLLARADRLVAVARFEIDLYSERLDLPRDRFALIPSGFELPAEDVEPAPSDGRVVIASIGRLERYKGHHRLIEALPRIAEQVPGATAAIVGSGPYEDELRRLAGTLAVSERVEIGPVPAGDRRRLVQMLSDASLVVLLSDFETQPMAVLEALALGRPTLVTYTSGLAELADEGLVDSVPAASTPAEIADAVISRLRSPRTPPKVPLPTWDECADRHLELYASILRR